MKNNIFSQLCIYCKKIALRPIIIIIIYPNLKCGHTRFKTVGLIYLIVFLPLNNRLFEINSCRTSLFANTSQHLLNIPRIFRVTK